MERKRKDSEHDGPPDEEKKQKSSDDSPEEEDREGEYGSNIDPQPSTSYAAYGYSGESEGACALPSIPPLPDFQSPSTSISTSSSLSGYEKTCGYHPLRENFLPSCKHWWGMDCARASTPRDPPDLNQPSTSGEAERQATPCDVEDAVFGAGGDSVTNGTNPSPPETPSPPQLVAIAPVQLAGMPLQMSVSESFPFTSITDEDLIIPPELRVRVQRALENIHHRDPNNRIFTDLHDMRDAVRGNARSMAFYMLRYVRVLDECERSTTLMKFMHFCFEKDEREKERKREDLIEYLRKKRVSESVINDLLGMDISIYEYREYTVNDFENINALFDRIWFNEEFLIELGENR